MYVTYQRKPQAFLYWGSVSLNSAEVMRNDYSSFLSWVLGLFVIQLYLEKFL